MFFLNLDTTYFKAFSAKVKATLQTCTIPLYTNWLQKCTTWMLPPAFQLCMANRAEMFTKIYCDLMKRYW